MGGAALASFSFVAYALSKKISKSVRLAAIGIMFATAYCFAFVIGSNVCFHGSALLLEIKTWVAALALIPFVSIVACFFISLFIQPWDYGKPGISSNQSLNHIVNSFEYFFKKHPFVISWILMIAGSIPYILLSWPVLWTFDAATQTRYLITGESISAWHPVIHTLWMSIPMEIANTLTGSYFLGVVFYGVTQVLITTAVYAYILTVISKWNISRIPFCLIVCFFVLYPGIAGYCTWATKDVVFSALFALLIVLVFDLIIFKNDSKRCYLAIWVVLLFVVLFRNNAAYGALLAFPLVLFLAKGKRIKVLCSMVSLLLVLSFVTGPLYSLANVRPASIGEMLSVPLSQISRAYNIAPNTFSDEQRLFVEEYIPTWSEYDPYLADSSKNYFPTDKFKDNPLSFFEQYLSIGFEHPNVYADAFLQLEIGYYAPVVFPVKENPSLMRIGLIFPYASSTPFSCSIRDQRINVHASTPLSVDVLDIYNASIKERWASNIPGVASLFQVGTWLWLIIFYVAVIVYLKKWKCLIPAVIFFGYWITCLFGPLSTVRYAMIAYTCAPSFLGALFVLRNNSSRSGCPTR